MRSGAAGRDRDRDLAEAEPAGAEAEQSAAGMDQGASDVDQSASAHDQRASDRDQAAADSDQAESDRARGGGATRAASRRARSQSTLERDVAAQARGASSDVRDHVAELRDRSADQRDAIADERDRLAAVLDAEMAALEAVGASGSDGPDAELAEVVRARRHAASARERAAATRAAASSDRQAARADRRRAAVDREAAHAELALEGADHLTGALRRRAGLRALARELARAERGGESLLVAFIDVNGLKTVNDAHGHGAGDELLCAVVASLRHVLRAYDVVMRYGGDEFVCVLCDQSATAASDRFETFIDEFAGTHGTRLSVGFAESGGHESPEELIARADAAMIAARAARRGESR